MLVKKILTNCAKIMILKNKTKVEITETYHTSDFRVGTKGYIDGYVVRANDIYAIVVADGQVKEHLINMLKIVEDE